MSTRRTTYLWPLAAAALSLLTPAASATPAHADVVAFSGTFSTWCAMPAFPQPVSGPYSCSHRASTVACGAVATGGAATGWPGVLCTADLTKAGTRGNAAHTADGLALWTCESGAGRGTLAYRSAPGQPVLRIPVTTVVIGSHVIVNGTYVQRGTGRTTTVRARFPAVCAWGTGAHGYHGTITTV